MTTKKFYKTKIVVEVLSEEPVDFDDLYGVHLSITDGDCSGKWDVESVTELNGEQAAKALMEQASDPGFFNLTETGEEVE